MKQEASRAWKASTRPTAIAAIAIAAAATSPAMAEAKAPAAASNWNATVIARDSDRSRLITAGRGGEVRTLITSKRLAERARPGQRLKVRVQRSADGTYEAKRLRVTGKAKRTRVRGAVVDRNASRYLVSAGGSVFTVKSKAGSRKLRRARASSAAVDVGDVIVSDVRIAANGLDEQRTRDVGNVSALELEGLFLSLENGVLTLAVEKRGAVEVAVPADLDIEAPAPGEELELLVSINPDGGFTLIALADEDGGIDFDHEDATVEIEGTVAALTDTSITVQGPGGVSLTCAISAGATLTAFAVGDEVELECVAGADGGFILQELESETAEFELEDEDEDEDEEEDEDERDDD